MQNNYYKKYLKYKNKYLELKGGSLPDDKIILLYPDVDILLKEYNLKTLDENDKQSYYTERPPYSKEEKKNIQK